MKLHLQQSTKLPILIHFFIAIATVLIIIMHVNCFSATTRTYATGSRNNLVGHQNNMKSMLLLTHQIKKCKFDAEKAVALLDQIMIITKQDKEGKEKYPFFDDEPYLAALHICGKANRLDLAMKVLNNCPTEGCRCRAISLCGKCKNPSMALSILFASESPTCACYNSAMAAQQDWNVAWTLLWETMPRTLMTTLSCNIVLDKLANARQGNEALRLLSSMDGKMLPVLSDRISFHHTIQAISRSGKWNNLSLKLLSHMKIMQEMHDFHPNNQTFDLLISACGKAGAWSMANRINEMCNSINFFSYVNKNQNVTSLYFEHWDMLEKKRVVGNTKNNGVHTYWDVGTYYDGHLNMTIGIQPNRNPRKNGMKLLFFKHNVSQLQQRQLQHVPNKIGYLLMINNSETKDSTLLGAYLDPNERARGLSKIVLAIWMELALMGKITPRTGVMQKPLLSLVLQHSFNFQPQKGRGIDVEISKANKNIIIVDNNKIAPEKSKNNYQVQLYSSSAKSLEGAFSHWHRQREGILLLKEPSTPRGRPIRVGSPFDPPTIDVLNEKIRAVVPSNALTWKSLSSEAWQNILLGT